MLHAVATTRSWSWLFGPCRVWLLPAFGLLALCGVATAQSFDSLSIQTQLPHTPARLIPAEQGLSPYRYQDMESLLSQGRAMQEQGNHRIAVAFLGQAWQAHRIRHGLYDESQLGLLEALILSEEALQNWEAVDDHYSYMELLYRRLYAVHDPRLEVGLGKVSAWLGNAMRLNFDGRRVEHLAKANRVYKLRLEVAQHTLAADDPKLAYLHENIKICERQLYSFADLDRNERNPRRRRPRSR